MPRPSLTAVPVQRSSLPILAIRRRVVIGALCAAAVSGLGSAVVTLTHHDPPAATIPARDEGAIALATVVANDYVNGRDSVVPAAQNVNVRYSTSAGIFRSPEVTFAGAHEYAIGDPGKAVVVQQVTFTVLERGSATSLYTMTVTMRHVTSGWVLASEPSLAPQSLSAATDGLDYSKLFAGGGDSGALSAEANGAAVKSQVERWANAFAGGGHGDKNLFAITGDKDQSHVYTGLGGWAVKSVSIVSYVKGANTNPQRVAQFGNQWMSVRVALALVPPGANGPTLNTEYDMLLEPEVNPAQPPVTAWGPTGSGTSALTDYGNATNG